MSSSNPSPRFSERGSLNLPAVAEEILTQWDREDTFKKSIDSRPADRPYVFYEGPPSANGQPGIHHVMARAIKDIFCRFHTLKGYRVERKAGWDTHGLPVELGVEKELGITKEDIGHKLTVEEYNAACRKAVMRYTDIWNDLTRKMGYWVDMKSPYVTYENKYIESVWWLLKELNNKNLLYKGYTVQPFSPAAGTGLSSHELNQPGAYRDVKDTTVVAQFRALPDCAERIRQHIGGVRMQELSHLHVDFLAWTTTPWTLPSNTALTVGPQIDYVLVRTTNRYTHEEGLVILAEALVYKQFGGKNAPEFEVVTKIQGSDLCGTRYEPLFDWAEPMDGVSEAFRVIPGDFVTTEDGTGIVHTAPTFGVDDARVAKASGVPPMLVDDGMGHGVPLVDLQGRFRDGIGPFAGHFVKQEYYEAADAPERSVDVEIAILLKERGQAFLVEKYEHNYPHCWRTDKPILYYPLDSWFIRATAAKERMQELNKTIRWKPASTGSGRFGKWLENLNDWNLSRSRFWGIPIPIWSTEDGKELRCIGSVEELKVACEEAVVIGLMSSNPLQDFVPGNMTDANYQQFDLHKDVVDGIVLKASDGSPMRREADLIDVWFDSGSMPYAQWHYPFENKEKIDQGGAFPADFIAEGVDQTRGWFYTLHAIATMVFDSVAYKSVISNGLVLDKNGVKMSKRLGNGVDPFATLEKYGPDATRWYMISNAQPWDNLKFDTDGIAEVQRKFFGTLHNTYNFLALYANIDGYDGQEPTISVDQRPEIDRWVLSRLHSLIAEVDTAYQDLEPTKAARAIQAFTIDDLSNWHVRLSRRRFWKGDMSADKQSAYQTLVECLQTIAVMGSPIAPFYLDQLHQDIHNGLGKTGAAESVHLATFPTSNPANIDQDLEARMALAQQISSQVLSLRKREKLRVRQPLRRILVPALHMEMERRLKAVESLIMSEVNVKALEIVRDGEGSDVVIVKRVKPDFKALGPRFGKRMKALASAVSALDSGQIQILETKGEIEIDPNDGQGRATVLLTDVEVMTDDIPGWLVSSMAGVTVALDITLDDALLSEGAARELVNRLQNLRKESGLEVTDRIGIELEAEESLVLAIKSNLDYIRTETLAEKILWTSVVDATELVLEDGRTIRMALKKMN
ncbi:MAG: isoleucine--tRNA ligase [Flavobacteriales bacterium]|nr:isoleucine--tRNA ligase [Flavobacteriales bacterium]